MKTLKIIKIWIDTFTFRALILKIIYFTHLVLKPAVPYCIVPLKVFLCLFFAKLSIRSSKPLWYIFFLMLNKNRNPSLIFLPAEFACIVCFDTHQKTAVWIRHQTGEDGRGPAGYIAEIITSSDGRLFIG